MPSPDHYINLQPERTCFKFRDNCTTILIVSRCLHCNHGCPSILFLVCDEWLRTSRCARRAFIRSTKKGRVETRSGFVHPLRALPAIEHYCYACFGMVGRLLGNSKSISKLDYRSPRLTTFGPSWPILRPSRLLLHHDNETQWIQFCANYRPHFSFSIYLCAHLRFYISLNASER